MPERRSSSMSSNAWLPSLFSLQRVRLLGRPSRRGAWQFSRVPTRRRHERCRWQLPAGPAAISAYHEVWTWYCAGTWQATPDHDQDRGTVVQSMTPNGVYLGIPRTMDEATSNLPAPDEVRAQLERMTASDDFIRSPQLGAFLRFVVESVLQGKSDRIKAYTIGVDVLRRDAKFDPQ